jgi:hypothetical protein
LEKELNQTYRLSQLFTTHYKADSPESVKMMDKVCLMTPENIHVNSFMYEPLIDMGSDHLMKLYTDILAL